VICGLPPLLADEQLSDVELVAVVGGKKAGVFAVVDSEAGAIYREVVIALNDKDKYNKKTEE
jgi:hypothetical protein